MSNCKAESPHSKNLLMYSWFFVSWSIFNRNPLSTTSKSLSSGSGLSKILVKGTDDIIDISKFNKGVYKNWRLGIDRSSGTINAHGGSYYKLTNTTSKSYSLTLDNTGKILRPW